jgi:diguanylate cyclase (GGDEF)-like protein
MTSIFLKGRQRGRVPGFKEIYRTLLSNLADLMRGRTVILMLYKEGDKRLQAEISVGIGTGKLSELALPIRQRSMEKIKQLLQNISTNRSWIRFMNRNFPGCCWMTAPLLVRQQPVGLLLLLDRKGGEFSQFERLIVEHFAYYMSLALNNILLYHTISDLSLVDGLTGLYNHRYFHERLKAEVTRSLRFKHKLSIMQVDIDDFNKFNRRHGYHNGDLILCSIADILRSHEPTSKIPIGFRESDVACRYGGEEFMVILTETPRVGALSKGELLRQVIENLKFSISPGRKGLRITVSIGIATLPDDATSADELIKASTAALLRAKQGGKNRVCIP